MLVDDDYDVMYNSLCSLSNQKNKMKIHREHAHLSPSPVLFENDKKKLTSIISECFSTDGKSPMACDKILNSKRNLFSKNIKSIGTSLKNCDLSDMISIDIEAGSTHLPLMCKLMIVVDGAAYERGKRMLLNDASCQIGEGNINILEEEKNSNSVESSMNTHLVRNQNTNEDNLMKIRSNENINYDEYNHQMDMISSKRRNMHQYDRNYHYGSLTDLNSSDISRNESSSNYFNRKVDDFDLDFYEYMATPYYGYQRHNLDKIDFSNGIQEEFLKKITRHEEKNKLGITSQMFQEIVEVHIPIQLRIPQEYQPLSMQVYSDEQDREDRFRNEKAIMINNNYHNSERNDLMHEQNHNGHFAISEFHQNFNQQFLDQLNSFRTLSNNMREYFNHRMNRFDTEFDLNFFNDNETISTQDYNRQNIIEVEHYPSNESNIHNEHHQENNPIDSCSLMQNVKVNKSCNIQGVQSVQSIEMNGSRGRKASVTNLMYMQVLNGNIITSV